jgi:hypothetical protein
MVSTSNLLYLVIFLPFLMLIGLAALMIVDPWGDMQYSSVLIFLLGTLASKILYLGVVLKLSIKLLTSWK